MVIFPSPLGETQSPFFFFILHPQRIARPLFPIESLCWRASSTRLFALPSKRGFCPRRAALWIPALPFHRFAAPAKKPIWNQFSVNFLSRLCFPFFFQRESKSKFCPIRYNPKLLFRQEIKFRIFSNAYLLVFDFLWFKKKEANAFNHNHPTLFLFFLPSEVLFSSFFILLGHSWTRFRVAVSSVALPNRIQFPSQKTIHNPPKPLYFFPPHSRFPFRFPQFSSPMLSFSFNSPILQKAQIDSKALFQSFSFIHSKNQKHSFSSPLNQLETCVSSPKFRNQNPCKEHFRPFFKNFFSFFLFNHLSQANVRAVVFQFWNQSLTTSFSHLFYIPKSARPFQTTPKLNRVFFPLWIQGKESEFFFFFYFHSPPHFIKTVPLTVVSLVRSLGQLESRWSIHARH